MDTMEIIDTNANNNNDDTLEGNTINCNDSNDGDSGNQKRKGRHTFPKITKVKVVDGKTITTYPFLEQSMESELVFCRNLASEKPFIAPYGTVSEAWQSFIAGLNLQTDNDNNPLFSPPITERYAKERVNEYFSFAKKNRIAHL